uniref:Uncharacterized protein n=1 Tax=Populus trichocarpa TaxID=3694 RepID=A0A2K1R7C6_POPTR
MVKNFDVFFGPTRGSLGRREISSASARPFILKLQPNTYWDAKIEVPVDDENPIYILLFKIGDKSRDKVKSGLLGLSTSIGAIVTLSCFSMPSYSIQTCIGWPLISVKFVSLPLS